jgi:hypothetical protein
MHETAPLLVLMPGLDGTGLLFERVAKFAVLRGDGPHFLLQAAPKECAETIAKLVLEDAPDVAARIGSDVVCKNNRKN